VLVGWLGPANVLLVDAATYLVAFVLVAAFVLAGRGRAAAAEDPRGMLAGVAAVATSAAVTFAFVAMRPEVPTGPAAP
jgi:hypothetical protein